MTKLISFFLFLFSFRNYSYAQGPDLSKYNIDKDTPIKRGDKAGINKLYGLDEGFTPTLDAEGKPVVTASPEKKDPPPPLQKTEIRDPLGRKPEDMPGKKEENNTPALEIAGEANKVNAAELLKDYKDNDVIEVTGPDGKPVKTTKAEYIAALPEPKPTEKKIGDKVYTDAEYSALTKKFLEKYKFTDDYLTKSDPVMLEQQLKVFADLSDGNKSLNERNQEFSQKVNDLKTKGEQIETIFKEASDAKKTIETQKRELEARIAKNEELIKVDTEAIDDFSQQQDAIINKKFAQKDNDTAKRDLDILNKRIEEQTGTLKTIENNAVQNGFNLVCTQIEMEIPELRLGEHPVLILEKYDKGLVTEDEARKANIAIDFASMYFNKKIKDSSFNTPIGQYWKVMSYKFGMSPTAQPVKTEAEEKPGDTLAKVKIKQLNAIPPLNGGGSASNKSSSTDEPKLERGRQKLMDDIWKTGSGSYKIG
jgi:hypothetical protein